MPNKLTPIAVHPLNEADPPVGCYAHHGRVYLEGQIYYGAFGNPGGVLVEAGGVPAAFRPVSDVAVDIFPDSPSSDSLYGDFAVFAGLVKADGSITVAKGSAVALLHSSKVLGMGVDLYLTLFGVSWVLDAQPDPVDQEPLAPWLFETRFGQDGVFPTAESFDPPEEATIGAHEARTHLGGKVTLVKNASGNVIDVPLPPLYRPLIVDKTGLRTTDGPGGRWWPAQVEEAGVSLNKMPSKPLLRGGAQPEEVFHDLGGVSRWEKISDPDLATIDGGVFRRILGIVSYAPEFPAYLEVHWSAPNGVACEFGAEFGLVMAYGDAAGQKSFYAVSAVKAKPVTGNAWEPAEEWWLVLRTFSLTAHPTTVHFPLVRLDNDDFPGELLGGVRMTIQIIQLERAAYPNWGGDLGEIKALQISTNASGTDHMVEYPQGTTDQLDDIGPILASDYNVEGGKWGFYTTNDPVGGVDSIRGDWVDQPNHYPPTWQPNYGYVEGGTAFDLGSLGWRSKDPDPPAIADVRSGVVRLGRK